MSSSGLYTAIHALDLPEPAWIEALFAEGRSLFDEGQGLFVYSYRVGTRPPLRLGALAGEHTAPGVWRTLEGWGSEYAGALAPAYVTGASGMDSLSPVLLAPLRDLRARFEPQAVGDLLMVLAHDPSGFGVFLTAPRALAPPVWLVEHRRLLWPRRQLQHPRLGGPNDGLRHRHRHQRQPRTDPAGDSLRAHRQRCACRVHRPPPAVYAELRSPLCSRFGPRITRA